MSSPLCHCLTRIRPSCTLFLKKSFTVQPARPEEAQAQAQAQLDTQAQEEAQAQLEAQEERCELPPDRPDLPERLPELPPERVREWLTGTLTTLT